MTKDILEADQEREAQIAILSFFNQIREVDTGALVVQRPGNDMALSVDIEIAGSPAIDIVGGAGGRDIPWHDGNGSRMAHF